MDWTTTTTTTTTMDNNVVVPPRFSRLPLLPMVSSISIGRSFSHDVTSTGQQETRKTPLLLNKGSRLFHLPAPSTCCFFWRLFDDKLKCLFFFFFFSPFGSFRERTHLATRWQQPMAERPMGRRRRNSWSIKFQSIWTPPSSQGVRGGCPWRWN